MKKTITSVAFVAFFGAYGLYQYFGNSNSAQDIALSQNPVTAPANTLILTQYTASSTLATAPQTAPATVPNPAPVPTPIVKPTGQYVDGTYTGSLADAYYGYVQIQATISGGKLASVLFLQYPNDRSTSLYINNQAMPMLKSEAIQAQNAQVNTVSGASDTSEAFRQSLSSALSKAKT
jgi:uncharacterized protein with FMN-binding domain